MSEKIRGFISESDFFFAKENEDCEINFSVNKKFVNSLEVEITVIEPVYEYRFIIRNKNTDGFFLSGGHYKDMDDCKNSISVSFEPIRIIEETKRIKK